MFKLPIGTKKPKQKITRIAILQSDHYPSISSLRMSVMDTFSEGVPIYHGMLVLDGHGDPHRMWENTCKALERQYDAVVAIGITSNLLLKSAMEQSLITKSVIFADVDNPVELGLLREQNIRDKHFTGVNATTKDYALHVEQLLNIVPYIKRALVICNSAQTGGQIPTQKNQLFAALKEHNVATYSLDENESFHIISKLPNFISDLSPDIIIMMKDEATQFAWKGVLNICNEMQVPLFAPDLDSVLQGSTIGCGISYEKIGEEVGQRAVDITKNGVKPIDLPLVTIKQPEQVWVNKESLFRHKVKLEEPAINWLIANGKVL